MHWQLHLFLGGWDPCSGVILAGNCRFYFGEDCGFPFVQGDDFIKFETTLATIYHSEEKSGKSASLTLLIRAVQSLCCLEL